MVYFLQYLAVRLIGWFLGVLPYGAAQRVGAGLGRLAAFLDARHLRRAEENIRLSLGVSEREARRIALGCFRHLGMVVAEFFQLARMKDVDEFRKVTVPEQTRKLRTLAGKGPGVVAATGHFGNWEYTGQISALAGLPPISFIKRFKNPYLDAFVFAVRSRWGLVPVDKSPGGVVKGIRWVRNGGVTAVLCDQHADEGIETVFFGRKCKTVDTAARIALKTGAPLVPVCSFRREDGKHEFVVGEEIPRPEGLSVDDAARKMTEEMNRRFEEIIRRHPEQWLWAQRRHRI